MKTILGVFVLPLALLSCSPTASDDFAAQGEVPQASVGQKQTSGNPIITHMYTADPSARVFNDRLYLYPSHDEDTATWFYMVDWHVFSTDNLVDWEDHGVALHIDSISWASQYAWAPDCIERNGKYYFYYPVDQEAIGVAVGDSPEGPFTDPLGKPLISKETPGVVQDRDFIDPGVFIDDDGQAYLYVGQNTVNVIKLNEDMVSFDGQVYQLEGVGPFFEAAWMHKKDGRYYFSYSGQGKIQYAVGDSPLGPFEHQGVILEQVSSGTNHHSIVEFKGQWYLFYHNADKAFNDLPYGHPYKFREFKVRRSVCVDSLFYDEDGTILPVKPNPAGVQRAM